MHEYLEVHVGILLVRRDADVNETRDCVVVRILDVDDEDDRCKRGERGAECVGRDRARAVPDLEWNERAGRSQESEPVSRAVALVLNILTKMQIGQRCMHEE